MTLDKQLKGGLLWFGIGQKKPKILFFWLKKKLVKTEEQGGQKKPQIAAQRRHFTSTSPSFTHSLQLTIPIIQYRICNFQG